MYDAGLHRDLAGAVVDGSSAVTGKQAFAVVGQGFRYSVSGVFNRYAFGCNAWLQLDLHFRYRAADRAVVGFHFVGDIHEEVEND